MTMLEKAASTDMVSASRAAARTLKVGSGEMM